MIAFASIVLIAGPASAHLDLVSTTPGDGAVKAEPVTEVKLEFSNPGEPSGDGIQIIDSSGGEVPATVRSEANGTTGVATPTEPLQNGKFGVKWSVAAPDAHPIAGAFRFSVKLPGAAKELAVETDTGAAVGADSAGELDPLEALLVDPDVAGAERVSWFGSTMALVGAVVGIGGLVFLGIVMAGRRSEVALITRRVRWSGAVLVVGTLIQVVALSAISTGGDWTGALAPAEFDGVLSGSFGWSILLRFAGGLLIIVGVHTAECIAPEAALATTHGEPGDPIVKSSLHRSGIAVAGAGLYLASFLLDGHTATKSPLWLVGATDIVHVLAAATWVGGIAMLATVLWRRKRAHHTLDAAYLAVRFSVVAGASLVLAGIAGVALTVEILDDPV